MMIKKSATTLLNGLKLASRHSVPAFSSSGLFHSSACDSKKNIFRSFASSSETPKSETYDSYIEKNWHKMSEDHKKNFSFTEYDIIERYPKNAGEIFFYRGLACLDLEKHNSEATLSFLRAIKNSTDNKLKLKCYDNLISLYEQRKNPIKVEEVTKKKQDLLVQISEIDKKKRLAPLIPEKEYDVVEDYHSINEQGRFVGFY